MAGFSSPCYTPIPDELFDSVMATLSGSELKVLLYVMRHTLGYRKANDTISLTQICKGIIKKDGVRLDSGTGLSRETVTSAIQSLTVKGYIEPTRHEHNGSHTVTSFTVVFTDGGKAHQGWSENTTRVVGKSDQGVVGKSDPQETIDTRNNKQETTTAKDEKKAAKDRAKAIALVEGLPDEHRSKIEAVLAVGMWSKFRYKPLSIEQIIDGLETCTHIEHVRLAKKSAAFFEGKNQDRPSITSLTDWWDRDEKKAIEENQSNEQSVDVPMTAEESWNFIAERTTSPNWSRS